MKIDISHYSKDLLYGFIASVFLHLSVLIGLTQSFTPRAVQVSPSYEVSLVHIKKPKRKIRATRKKKVKKIKKKVKPKPKKIPPIKKKKVVKPVVEDEIKIAVPKKPPPPDTPPPPKEVPPPPKPVSKLTREDGAASQMTVESAKFTYQWYVNIIHRKIMTNWFPENDYVKPESEVTIHVYFRIQKSGEISELKLVSGSGEDILDKSAVSAIVSSKPYPRLPDGFVDSYLGVNFRFILHGVQWENE